MQCGAIDAKFADDMSAFAVYDGRTPNSEILEGLRLCQETLHEWGVYNRVTFDYDNCTGQTHSVQQRDYLEWWSTHSS